MKKNEKKMVFLAHWVEGWNLLLKISPHLRKNPGHYWMYFPLFPFCWITSIFFLFGKKSFDIVDDFCFETDEGRVHGKTVLIRNFGLHFFLPGFRKKIQKRILKSVLKMQNDADIIGLGALVKDERVTQGGRYVVENLNDRLTASILHGDTLTAAVVYEQTKQLLKSRNVARPVFLTGATSKIGRAVALSLAKDEQEVLMYTKDEGRFNAIREEAGEKGRFLVHARNLKEGQECSLWVTGKSIPSGKELLDHVPPGSAVLNFAVPNPLTKKDGKKSDLSMYEGGLLCYDTRDTNLSFTMRLQPGVTYACHAATILAASRNWKAHEVGPVNINEMQLQWEEAQKAGFFLPPL